MTTDLKSLFGVNQNSASEGSWFEVCESEPGKMMRFKLAFMGSSNKKFMIAASKHARNQRQSSNLEVAAEINKKVFIETILLTWENVILKKEDGVLPYSKENANLLVSELPVLFEAMVAFASDVTNYQIDDKEALAKNFPTV